MTEFLPCPRAFCPHNCKFKAVKRPADPVIRPAKLTAKATKNQIASDFVFPKKTINSVPAQKRKKSQLTIELNRTYPNATNTFTKGYIKIEAQTGDDHRDITNYLTGKKLQYYVIEPPFSRPLKLVIKGLPADLEPEDIKNDLISKGIKIEKIAQLKKFTTKTPLPIYMIEVTRDENVNNIYQIVHIHCVSNSIDVFAPSTPTTFGNASASIIDYALIKNLNWPCTIDSISELSSDHNPVKLHFPRTAKFERPPTQLNNTWSIFKNTLATTENCYLPKARLLKERNRAGKLWQFTRHPQHKTELKRLQNTIKRKVGLYRQQVWEDHLTSLDTEDGSLWGTAKAFRKKATPILALNGPNGTALSDTNKTDLMLIRLRANLN
ncbi:uncharacterized protein TNIN_149011 [Trichonephila inaurata madagascariensis]|uniref:Endonuclease/exonuclease/phosphatase domain-containing protein n=1 Tax=Trichonephila inaurata madagascariensis TaxID=2747483 RepID=A0A8X7CFL0_9ARAC|nr:uncharacterized protein TNIN_149011 [Trichonephila inaurata madagascariensis]